eukprot:5285226-Amphidinium_carterae.1
MSHNIAVALHPFVPYVAFFWLAYTHTSLMFRWRSPDTSYDSYPFLLHPPLLRRSPKCHLRDQALRCEGSKFNCPGLLRKISGAFGLCYDLIGSAAGKQRVLALWGNWNHTPDTH